MPLNHPGRGPIHLLLVDWDPITIPNRARMKEWQTACEKAYSLMLDWWDKSWGGSWGIPYRNEHAIKKNLWCHTALENRSLYSKYVRSVYLCLCIFVATNACSSKKLFLPFNHKKPIRMCHEFQFYLSRADNTHFLVFNAAKHSHSLIATQKQLEMSAK